MSQFFTGLFRILLGLACVGYGGFLLHTLLFNKALVLSDPPERNEPLGLMFLAGGLLFVGAFLLVFLPMMVAASSSEDNDEEYDDEEDEDDDEDEETTSAVRPPDLRSWPASASIDELCASLARTIYDDLQHSKLADTTERPAAILDGKFVGTVFRRRDQEVIPPDQFMVFLAKDNALPLTLRFYKAACQVIGAEAEQLNAVDRLIHRVDVWRHHNMDKTKIPDAAPGECP